jgi:hypothetical protein
MSARWTSSKRALEAWNANGKRELASPSSTPGNRRSSPIARVVGQVLRGTRAASPSSSSPEFRRNEGSDPSGFASPSKAALSGSSGFASLSAPRRRISSEGVSHTTESGADAHSIDGVAAGAEAGAASAQAARLGGGDHAAPAPSGLTAGARSGLTAGAPSGLTGALSGLAAAPSGLPAVLESHCESRASHSFDTAPPAADAHVLAPTRAPTRQGSSPPPSPPSPPATCATAVAQVAHGTPSPGVSPHANSPSSAHRKGLCAAVGNDISSAVKSVVSATTDAVPKAAARASEAASAATAAFQTGARRTTRTTRSKVANGAAGKGVTVTLPLYSTKLTGGFASYINSACAPLSPHPYPQLSERRHLGMRTSALTRPPN